MLNRSASLAMSTSVLKALPGKLDIKRHSPSILYVFSCNAQPTFEILLGLQFNDLPDRLVQKHIEHMFLDSGGLSSWIHYIEDLT